MNARHLLWLAAALAASAAVADDRLPMAGQILDDGPVAYWDMESGAGGPAESRRGSATAQAVGRVELGAPGPRPPQYPSFAPQNRALRLFGQRGFLRVHGSEALDALAFHQGDEITLEAWVQLAEIADGQQVYIVGKGRTHQGAARENQNYALRLRGIGGTARISFLFRSQGPDGDHHRWNSQQGFVAGGAWRHVAVTYRFGSPESIRGYLDGRPVSGAWDLGGATSRPPVVDDDELWIGSSMGGSPGSTFRGRIDEVAVFRRALPAARLGQRFQRRPPPPRDLAQVRAALPDDQVLVTVFDAVSEGWVTDSWSEDELPEPRVQFLDQAFAVTGLPRAYLPGGVLDQMPNPQLVRVAGKRRFAAGAHEFLLRSKSASRLWLDGQLVAQTPFMQRNASGHEAVPQLAERRGRLPTLAPGHQEQAVVRRLEAGEHLVEWELLVGGNGLRPEPGESYLAVRPPQGEFVLLAPQPTGENESLNESLNEATWDDYLQAAAGRRAALDTQRRRRAAAEHDGYWQQRHQLAAEVAGSRQPSPPETSPDYPQRNVVDQFVNARLAEQGLRPAARSSDEVFLRRLTLDVTGVIPTLQELQEFRSDTDQGRRRRAIERLLADPRWADHWTAYWQDVLAENPGILKPKLNNTGPFRWWIYESFLDNKPIDRMVTELIEMRGGKYDGGPAGFAMATQNDVPMASKAHVLAKAFLGVDMTCARCHDAPHHPYKQAQLFGLAALLQRQPITLPASSSVGVRESGRQPLVDITLKPGEQVAPQWPFPQWSDPQLAERLLRDDAGARERLAALITSPHNDRFAQVIVNRMWKRYFGQGLLEPADDWHDAEPSHPALLEYLACELAAHRYDLKHVARLILDSHAYQRQLSPECSERELRLLAAPRRRRLTAEQLLDSLFTVAGKELGAEMLTLDPEGRRGADTFLNLGTPRRAWQFTSLSNERDRPALALPAAQSMVDLLLAFGWRDSRPHPVTVREQSPTVLQPLSVANGVASMRVTQLSDDHRLTDCALRDQPLESLVESVFETILTRRPSQAERQQFVELLREGYESRRIAAAPIRRPSLRRHAVSWSNHLNSQATRIKLEVEREVRAGDPPTARLRTDWRQRLEDMVWALINSPEFMFVP